MKTEREIELEKQVATLRAALEELVTPNRGMGFGGMDRRFAEENARAVLADPNLGTDWVSGDAFHACDVERGALQVKLAETQERHQAELQRLEGTLAEQARALEELTKVCEVAKEDHDARIAKAIEVLEKVDEIACRSGPIIGTGEEQPEPLNPDGCELALLAREALAVLRATR